MDSTRPHETGVSTGLPHWLIGTWIAVVGRPDRFFRQSIRRGDQSGALLFVAAIVLTTIVFRLGFGTLTLPTIGTSPLLSTLLWIGVLIVLVTPLLLHLLAAVQTVILIALAPNRAGISETVQILAYAAAPCVFTGFDHIGLTLLASGYALVLVVYGTTVVHDCGWLRATIAGGIPAVVALGVGFGGFAALEAILRAHYIISV